MIFDFINIVFMVGIAICLGMMLKIGIDIYDDIQDEKREQERQEKVRKLFKNNSFYVNGLGGW